MKTSCRDCQSGSLWTAVALILMLVLETPSISAQSPPGTSTPAPEERAFLEMAREALSGRVHLSGRIVDESGALLKDVTIAIKKTYFDPTGRDFGREVETRVMSDGRFSISCLICLGIELRLHKEGYFDEVLSATTLEDDRPSRDVSRSELIVTLQNRGRVGGLRPIEGKLRILGPNTVYGLVLAHPSRPPQIERFVFKGGLPHRADWNTTVVSATQAADRFLYLAPSGGLAALVEKRQCLRPDGTLATDSFEPVGVRLCASGNERDGFVVARPVRLAADDRMGMRELREAPESGYESCLALDDNQQYTYFYCRLGALYGKGVAVKPAFSSPQDAQSVFARVTVLLSVDGTRNTQGDW